jgi:hypothetical protein
MGMSLSKDHTTVPLTCEGEVVGTAKVYLDGTIQATIFEDTPTNVVVDSIRRGMIWGLSVGTNIEGKAEAAIIPTNPLLKPKYVNVVEKLTVKEDGPTEDLSDIPFTKAIRGGAKMDEYISEHDPVIDLNSPEEVVTPMAKAMAMVVTYVNETSLSPITTGEVRLVWFCKTLENWKALVITTLNDQTYYEVTHSGANKNTCIDVYKKVDQMMVGDPEE